MRYAYQPLPGEPNQLCDILAASIIDEYEKRDPNTIIKCSVNGGHGALFVSGQVLSQADFDVSALIKRVLSAHDIHEGIEPFIALEPVASDNVGLVRQVCDKPVMAFGYATKETEELLPAPVTLARRVANWLSEKRQNDPEWFWLGLSGWVVCGAEGVDPNRLIIQIDHGNQELTLARRAIINSLSKEGVVDISNVDVNPLGPSKIQNLAKSVGSSGRSSQSYGTNLPSNTSISSQQSWHADTLGQIMARKVAVDILNKNSKSQAVMVRLFYVPGETKPKQIWIKDEHGNDLASLVSISELDLENIKSAVNVSGKISELLQKGL